MENVFIATENVSRFNDICTELESPESLIGPSLAIVTGPAGRGKSDAAKHYAARGDAIYLPPMNKRSPLMLLREITFELCGAKPGRIEACLDMIVQEIGRRRRLVIVDEADLLPMSILEMLRNVNERCDCPILMLGEEEFTGRIASRRRLSSRIRRSMEFRPLSQPDIMLFFKKALNLPLTTEQSVRLHRHSRGDWRPVLVTAVAVERAMKASHLKEIPAGLIKELTDGKH